MTNSWELPWQFLICSEKNMDVHRAKAKELSQIKSIKPVNRIQTVDCLCSFQKILGERQVSFPEGGIEIKGKFVSFSKQFLILERRG